MIRNKLFFQLPSSQLFSCRPGLLSFHPGLFTGRPGLFSCRPGLLTYHCGFLQLPSMVAYVPSKVFAAAVQGCIPAFQGFSAAIQGCLCPTLTLPRGEDTNLQFLTQYAPTKMLPTYSLKQEISFHYLRPVLSQLVYLPGQSLAWSQQGF